ncbi:MAG: hypothetical protein ACRDTM_13965 [Micromonosporaceae bacterium]
MEAQFPDLRTFRLHKVIEDIDFDGASVPGLRGSFYRRRDESVGVYSYAGRELFMAWGYVGEEHCRFTAVRRPDGSWARPHPGCPAVRVLRNADDATAVTGVEIRAG